MNNKTNNINSKMNTTTNGNQNYSPFNNRRKYGKNNNNNKKYVTINNFNMNKSTSNDEVLKQVKNQNTKNIVEILSRPVVNTTIEVDRYSPGFEKVNTHDVKQDTHLEEESNILKHIKLFKIIGSNNVSPVPPEVEQNNVHEEETKSKIEEIIFTDEIRTVYDLIQLSKKYPYEENKRYTIDLKKLHAIVPFLQELDNMIGMEEVKISLTDQLMYFLQGFEYRHALHTIIEGPPGVGKTCLGRILGNIYLHLNCINTDNLPEVNDESKEEGMMSMHKLLEIIIKKEEKQKETPKKLKFRIAKRSDLVGQYVGHTAVKTQKIINESFGGVLFIDEAYSLGGDDAFSKECINTINQNLSEHCDKFICIIAGYADTLESNFFALNSGLHRRFPFRYTIQKYTGSELAKMLRVKIDNEFYVIDPGYEKQVDAFVEENKDYFPNFGGDIETYFFHIKMMHAKRVFGKSIKLRNIFSRDDFEKGLEKIKKNQKKEEVKLDMYN
jgi:stage V sporulation protein K